MKPIWHPESSTRIPTPPSTACTGWAHSPPLGWQVTKEAEGSRTLSLSAGRRPLCWGAPLCPTQRDGGLTQRGCSVLAVSQPLTPETQDRPSPTSVSTVRLSLSVCSLSLPPKM